MMKKENNQQKKKTERELAKERSLAIKKIKTHLKAQRQKEQMARENGIIYCKFCSSVMRSNLPQKEWDEINAREPVRNVRLFYCNSCISNSGLLQFYVNYNK